VTLKVVPKAACDPEIFGKPVININGENKPMRARGKVKQKFNAAFGTVLIIYKCFKESNRIFIFIFLLNKAD
jgi:hypothetical protein